MNEYDIPRVGAEEIRFFMSEAAASKKLRCAKILHKKGDEFNHVFNFLLEDSYMQPHLHPGPEKIEKIHLIQGSLASIFFDDNGNIVNTKVLMTGGQDFIEIPAFSWHTYVMLTPEVITYETMMGVYEPGTWKKFPEWAPEEGLKISANYLQQLRSLL